MTDAADAALDARYRFAQGLARRAGERALRHWRARDRLVVELKGSQDWVSEADRDVENLLREEIAAAFPQDRFLGEETAAAVRAEAEEALRAGIKAAEAEPAPDPSLLFEHAYVDPPEHLYRG